MAALRASSRVQGVTLWATNVHRARKEMHDDIAAAQNGDSYDQIHDGSLQDVESAFRLGCFPRFRTLLVATVRLGNVPQIILTATITFAKRRRITI